MTTAVAAAFSVEMLLMIALPIIAAVVICRRHSLPLTVPLAAASFFIINMIITAPLTRGLIPANFGRSTVILLLGTVAYSICQELARYASFRFAPALQFRRNDWAGVAAGVGFGGAEAIVIGVQFAWGMGVILLAPQRLGPGVAEQTLSASPWLFLLTGLDRVPAIICSVAFSLLVVMAFRKGTYFLWVAIGLHAALDVVLLTAQRFLPGIWHEVVFVTLAVIAVVFIRRTIRGGTLSATPEGYQTSSPATVGP
ncbi:hypothetical protein GCM10009841_03280 [Microlunatus panaciterrae]|uniref:Membrane protein YhfC n=1 Tax=Microlunatus panaciterrae TaxID=400768 RepID=A0ABS2RJ48_9ACTN|nr:YhfC family glutamic-type intramembrane protease [Microlunatus panaciterrae]MBM7799011.1 putative membrane protein YhfC [Microlunatus panaciterrae]